MLFANPEGPAPSPLQLSAPLPFPVLSHHLHFEDFLWLTEPPSLHRSKCFFKVGIVTSIAQVKK